VQPVLSAGANHGLFESEMANVASGLTVKTDRVAVAKKATTAGLDGKSQGFGFAGKAQNADIALLMIGDTIGMLPTAMKLDAAQAKQSAMQLAAIVAKIEGRVDPQVIKALNIALQACQEGDFDTTTKALLVAMATSADAIKKGSERAHGYMATGLYAGIATIFAASGTGNQTLADIGDPLVQYLQQDAALGGADRAVAAQVKLVAAELGKSAPSLDVVVGAIGAMNAVKPD
jgi:hypothetical protein